MKLFKSLLVAPATLGLLAPMSATANEVTINDFNPAEELAITNSRVDGLEARLNNFEAGSFSETTSASFTLEAAIGAVDGDTTSDAVGFDQQFGIGLTTSFTGEDSLDITIDSGTATQSPVGTELDYDSGTGLNVDGIKYSFPVGSASAFVGDQTDISDAFTGACAYTGFTDYMGDCGTGNTVGVGGNGVTTGIAYTFDSGFSLAGGISSQNTSVLTTQGTDTIGVEAAYTADKYGVALAYVDADGGTGNGTSFWGLNAQYSPEATNLPSISVGFELQTVDNSGDDAEGYFFGLTWDEVGPGSVSLGGATRGNFGDGANELMIYEAAYTYPVNDAITVTPGVFIEETGPGVDDKTGVIVKSSFSF